MYDARGKQQDLKIVVPRDMLGKGVRINDIHIGAVMSVSSYGFKLNPGDQWLGFAEMPEGMFSKNTKTYLEFECLYRGRKIKKRIKKSKP